MSSPFPLTKALTKAGDMLLAFAAIYAPSNNAITFPPGITANFAAISAAPNLIDAAATAKLVYPVTPIA